MRGAPAQNRQGELVNNSEPSTSTSFPSLSFKRGILLKSAKHMASKIVDFPAPVFPTTAIKPALAKGSLSKSIKCSPEREAKFLYEWIKLSWIALNGSVVLLVTFVLREAGS